MAKQIRANEVIEDNHLDNAIKSAETFLGVLKKIDTQIKETAKTRKDGLVGIDPNTAKGVKQINEEVTKSTKLKKEAIKVDKELVSLQKQEAQLLLTQDKLKQSKLRTEKQLLQQQKSLDAQERKRIKTLRESNSEYKKQSKELNDLRRRFKDLSAAGRGSGRVARGLLKDITRLDTKLKQVDKSAGQFGRNVGNYPSNLGRAAASVKKFATAIGLTSGIFLLVRGIKDSIATFANFEQANANLASILGTSKELIGELTDEAKRLGSVTAFTATQVSQLQTEFAKLGFTTQEIINATEATLSLAQATGTDLAQAAKQVGSAIRAFGLDASEAGRVSDVFASATSKSALSMEFLATAVSTVAPVANKFGFSIEESTALLGKLADAGFDASSSATATKNILLNLADSNGALAKSLNEPVKDLPSLVKGLNQLQNEGIDLAGALELTDKRSVAAFATFLDGANDVQVLSDALENSGGVAEEMANTQLDTLQGAIKLLQSAWESVVLSFFEGNGALNGLKDVIVFLAKNLKTIVRVLGTVIKAFVTYKIATLAATLAVKAYTFAQKLATKGLKAFNIQAKLNPFGLIATAIILLLPFIKDLALGLSETTEEVEELTDAERVLQEVSDETSVRLVKEQAELQFVFEALKRTTAGTEERQKALDKVNDKYGLTLQNLEDEGKFVDQLNQAYTNLVETLEKRIRVEAIRDKLTELLKEKITVEALLVNAQAAALNVTPLQDFNDEDFISFEETFAQGLEGNLASIEAKILALQETAGDVDLFGDLLGVDEQAADGKTTKKKKGKTAKQLRDQEFRDIVNNNKESLKVIERNLRQQGATEDEIRAATRARRLANLQIENDASLRIFGSFSEEFLNANLALTKGVADIKKDSQKTQEELDNQRFKDLITQGKLNAEVLETELIKNGKTREEIQKELAEQRIQALRDERELALEVFGQSSDEFIEADLKLNQALLKQREDAQKELEKVQKEQLDSFKDSAQTLVDLIETLIDSLVTKIDLQIEKANGRVEESQTRVQSLQEQAAAGNLSAEESIKVEKKRQSLEKGRIEELENRKKNLLIIVTALELANSKIQSGDGSGLANASSEMGSFLSGLEGFYEGTNTTVGDALGDSGRITGDRDTHVVKVHEDETILGVDNSRKLDGMTQEQITKGALLYRNGELAGTRAVSSVNRTTVFNDSRMVDAIRANTAAIKNIDMPEYHSSYDAVSKLWTDTTRTRNKIQNNHRKTNGMF